MEITNERLYVYDNSSQGVNDEIILLRKEFLTAKVKRLRVKNRRWQVADETYD